MNKQPPPLKKRLDDQARHKFLFTVEIRVVHAGRYTFLKLADMSMQWLPDMPSLLQSSYFTLPHVASPPKPLPYSTPRHVDCPPKLATSPPICNSPTCRFPSKLFPYFIPRHADSPPKLLPSTYLTPGHVGSPPARVT